MYVCDYIHTHTHTQTHTSDNKGNNGRSPLFCLALPVILLFQGIIRNLTSALGYCLPKKRPIALPPPLSEIYLYIMAMRWGRRREGLGAVEEQVWNDSQMISAPFKDQTQVPAGRRRQGVCVSGSKLKKEKGGKKSPLAETVIGV